MTKSTPTRDMYCIFDLEYASFGPKHHGRAGMYPMLISAYYKSRNLPVVFTTSPPDFSLYKLVFIIKDAPNLDHNPDWLTQPNVRLVGPYWPVSQQYYNGEWDNHAPDISVYNGWVSRQGFKEVPHHFTLTPFKVVRNGNLFEPEGKNLLIVDSGLEFYPEILDMLRYANIENAQFSSPLSINSTNYENVFALSKSGSFNRGRTTYNLLVETFELEEWSKVGEVWQEYRMGTASILNPVFSNFPYAGWMNQLDYILEYMQEIFAHLGRTGSLQVYGMDKSPYPSIINSILGGATKGGRLSLIDKAVRGGRGVSTLISLLDEPHQSAPGRNLVNFIAEVATHPDLLSKLLHIPSPPSKIEYRPYKMQPPKRLHPLFAPIQNNLFTYDPVLGPVIKQMIENEKNKYPAKASDRWNLRY